MATLILPRRLTIAMPKEFTKSAADPIDLLPTREGYDRWAEFYDVDDNPLVALEEPLMDRFIGNVRGLTVADIGCGTGRHALRLAAAGANVEALDFSEAMLQRARPRPALRISSSASTISPSRCRFLTKLLTASCADW